MECDLRGTVCLRIHLTSVGNGVLFDVEGDGQLERIPAWTRTGSRAGSSCWIWTVTALLLWAAEPVATLPLNRGWYLWSELDRAKPAGHGLQATLLFALLCTKRLAPLTGVATGHSSRH